MVYRNENTYLKWDAVGTDNSGDIVHDAIWKRNQNVEDRFGFTLNIQPTKTKGLAKVTDELKTLVFSGSQEFDVIVSTGNSTVSNSLYPYLYELSNVPHLDIEQPWWKTNAIKEMSFDGKNYRYLMGDIMLVDYLKCGVFYYNKDIYTNVTKADPDEMYRLVLDGKWTWDKVCELSASGYVDVNGDGVSNVGDQFGMMFPVNGVTDAMVIGCDVELFARKEGGIDLSVMNNERVISVIDKLISAANNTDGVWISDLTADKSPPYFAKNYSMLYLGRLNNAVTADMRDMQADYGILPMPKLEAEQEEYITYIDDSATVACVPKSVADDRIEMVGAFLEGWGSEAYRTVITPFIESAMKAKYSRDELSGQSIDIIFNNGNVSFLMMYNKSMNSIFDKAIAECVDNGQNNFASVMAELLVPAQNSIDTYIKEILAADQ